jgi:hypothetical protein
MEISSRRTKQSKTGATFPVLMDIKIQRAIIMKSKCIIMTSKPTIMKAKRIKLLRVTNRNLTNSMLTPTRNPIKLTNTKTRIASILKKVIRKWQKTKWRCFAPLPRTQTPSLRKVRLNTAQTTLRKVKTIILRRATSS